MEGDETGRSLPDEALARVTVYTRTGTAAELIRVLGIKPDKAWNAGDPTKTGRKYETTGVSFVSRVAGERPPAEHLTDVLDQLEPMRDSLARHVEEGNIVRLKLAVFADSDNPEFTLPADVIRRISTLDLDLHFDVYDV